MSKQYDVIVIGAGHNGLTLATYLAKQNKRVLLCEKRERVGGLAAAEEFHPGYQAPGLLHDTTTVSQDVIQTLELEKHGLKRYEKRPPIFAPQAQEEGVGLLLYPNAKQAEEELSKHSPEDAKAYIAYEKFFQDLRKLVKKVASDVPPPIMRAEQGGLWGAAKTGISIRLLGKQRMMELLRSLPMCLGDFLDDWFQSDLLKAVLAGPAIYGSFTGPRSPGSTTPHILHTCLAEAPIYGAGKGLIEALEKAAESQGVEVKTNAEVTQILVQNEKVEGVRIGEEKYNAPIVVSACDPKQTFLKLIPALELPATLETRFLQYRTRGTTAKMNLALKKQVHFACRPEHQIEFARTGEAILELEKAFDPVKYKQIPKTPTLDIFVPTVANPELAPEDHQVMSILVHFVPYTLEKGWSDETKEQLSQNILQTLQRYIPDIRDAMVGHQLLSPVDIEEKYGTTEGHIFHGEPALDQLLLRPIPECARYHTPFQGLYLCSSGTHPGGGLTCLPGANAAKHLSQ